jgi:hypothetical protein
VRRGQSARRGARTVDPDAPRTLPVLGGMPTTDDEPDDPDEPDEPDGAPGSGPRSKPASEPDDDPPAAR